MRMRRADDLAPKHARHRHVGPVLGAAGDLWHPVGADRPGSDPFELLWRNVVHRSSPSSRVHKFGADYRLAAAAQKQNRAGLSRVGVTCSWAVEYVWETGR